ncbi:SRPBCC family protein [Chitinophaga costaii]|nr:SRPBCC domain-containing protein [Chitinophaga costaii]
MSLLFTAYEDAAIVGQWMGTNVLQLENKKHGSYAFQTTNAQGQVVFAANGVIHSFIPNQEIIRTFEMEHSTFGVQLEFLTFEQLTENTSRLTMHVVYRSVDIRDQILKMPFAAGINMAHNRLQDILSQLK